MNRKNLLSMGLAAMMVLTGSSRGQSAAQQSAPPPQSSIDQDVELMRKDLRSQKKQIIAANMQLSDQEAEKFWPLYDQYTAEVVKINDTKYAAIKEYATNFNTLTDEQAVGLAQKSIGVDKSLAELRLKYIPMFNKVVSGRKTAFFFQLDRRLVQLIDLQLASQIPMVQP